MENRKEHIEKYKGKIVGIAAERGPSVICGNAPKGPVRGDSGLLT
jgi:hypothetical protein